MGDNRWSTELSCATEDGIRLRGYDLIEMLGRVPFPSALYLLFTGELPSPAVGRLMDAIMLSGIDHGPGSPSALAARTVASGSGQLGQAVAGGILALGTHHGGAIEDSMEAIAAVRDSARGDGDLQRAADEVVAARRAAGRRVGGFGHRWHKRKDPRLDRMMEIAGECDFGGEYIRAMYALEAALGRSSGKALPVNVDGIIAAFFCEFGFPKTLANAVFLASRVVGVIAHAHEEITKMTPMRKIDPVDHFYAGPPERPLPATIAETK